MKLYINAYQKLDEEDAEYFKGKLIKDYPIFDSIPDSHYEFDILNGKFGLRAYCHDIKDNNSIELPYVLCHITDICTVYEEIPEDYMLDDLEYAYRKIIKDKEFIVYINYLKTYNNFMSLANDISNYYSDINNKYGLDINLQLYLGLGHRQELRIYIKVGVLHVREYEGLLIIGNTYDTNSIINKINSYIFQNLGVSDFNELKIISNVYPVEIEIMFHSYEQGWRHTDFDHTEEDVEDAIHILDKELNEFDCIHKLYLYKEECRFLFTVVGSREEVEDVEKFIDNDLSEFTGLKIEYNEGRMSLIEQEDDIPKFIQEYVKEYM